MLDLAKELFPINRSISGKGVRKTIKIPAKPARNEQRIKLRIFTLFVLTPIAFAAA